MADLKVTELSALAIPEVADELYIVDDVAGTPTQKSITTGTLLNRNLTSAESSAGLIEANIDVRFDTSDVRRYGTVGDGVADDTVAIQTAINVASFDRRKVFIPAGRYKFSQLYLYFDSTNNPNFNSTVTEAGPLAIEGEGAMQVNHVNNGVTVGTVLESSETTNNCVLLDLPTGGADSDPARVSIRNLSVTATTAGFVLQLNQFENSSVLEDVFVHQKGAGGGITMADYWFAEFHRVTVLGPHTGFNIFPSAQTGIGWRLQNQGGSHSTWTQCRARGFNIGFSIGDSGTTVKESEFDSCQASSCNYGFITGAGVSGFEFKKCNAEICTYRAIETNGAGERIRINGGQFQGVVGDWIASTAFVENEVVQNDSGKLYRCTTSGTSAASGGPTGTGTGISDGTCVWDFNVTSAESDFTTIELATDTVNPWIQHAIIRGPEGGSCIKLVDSDSSMRPVIEGNRFNVNSARVTTLTGIDSSGSATDGQGTARYNEFAAGVTTEFSTPSTFQNHMTEGFIEVKRDRSLSIAATISIGTSARAEISGNGTNVTAIASAIDGRTIMLIFTTSGATIEHSSSLVLIGGVNFTTTRANTILQFWSDGTNWYEIGTN